MRFLSTLLSVSLLFAGSLAAKKNSAERFDDFFTKSKATGPLKLSETTYKSLTSTPRDYSAAVLLTAQEARFGCVLCQQFKPEWDLLANSWHRGDKKGESRLLFGTLDFSDGREVFLSFGLQTAPVLFFFPPTHGPHAAASAEPIRYDFTGGPASAEQIHDWLARNLPDRPHPSVKRPINWMRWATGMTLFLGAITVGATAWPYVLPIVQSRNVWASVSLISILLFTSGHMFNHIRKVPYVAGDGKGGISYFSGNFQSQYGLETQVVAAIYGILSFCAISLAAKVSRIADAKSQQAAVIGWSVLIFLLYSFLLSIFKIKNSGYPFALPPFM
ncbi:OST3/OST6 family protein [Stachybotrys elegans]|uniref:OST3/OST6 family protein n=1 Tax=Stachybotrys elegans TaxID=80388 RepID=A0A8K0WUW6_9HYPO|nr:OST3/OST6 family protein [Stachybotrys elegans]